MYHKSEQSVTQKDFLAWEQASRDSIDVKRCYVDLAGGDLIAGILLSQIIFWHLPGRDTGKTKLRVEHDGFLWIAKGRADWWDECRISAKQFDRASGILERLGLIKTITKRFYGNPTKHSRLCWDEFLRQMSLLAINISGGNPLGKLVIPQTSITNLPKGQELIRPKVNNQFTQRSITLTETTSESTSENTSKITTETPESGGGCCDIESIATQQQHQVMDTNVPMASDQAVDTNVSMASDQVVASHAYSIFAGHKGQGKVEEYLSVISRCQGRAECWDIALLAARTALAKGTLGSPVAFLRSITTKYLMLDKWTVQEALIAAKECADLPAVVARERRLAAQKAEQNAVKPAAKAVPAATVAAKAVPAVPVFNAAACQAYYEALSADDKAVLDAAAREKTHPDFRTLVHPLKSSRNDIIAGRL